MKKIYSLVAALLLVFGAMNAAVVVDANFGDIDGSAWTSANGNWDWDQTAKDNDGKWIPINKFVKGQEITINLECWIDDQLANFEGDSVTVMCGWFTMTGATPNWSFVDVATYNKPFPTITDWSATSAYELKVTLDVPTSEEVKAATTSTTPDADFYMFQIKAFKDGAAYGPANINMNFIVMDPAGADDVAAAAAIYPNPVAAGETVTIEGEFTVANVAGAIVAAGADKLDTSDLNAGIYFVSVAGTVTKLVVE